MKDVTYNGNQIKQTGIFFKKGDTKVLHKNSKSDIFQAKNINMKTFLIAES